MVSLVGVLFFDPNILYGDFNDDAVESLLARGIGAGFLGLAGGTFLAKRLLDANMSSSSSDDVSNPNGFLRADILEAAGDFLVAAATNDRLPRGTGVSCRLSLPSLSLLLLRIGLTGVGFLPDDVETLLSGLAV